MLHSYDEIAGRWEVSCLDGVARRVKAVNLELLHATDADDESRFGGGDSSSDDSYDPRHESPMHLVYDRLIVLARSSTDGWVRMTELRAYVPELSCVELQARIGNWVDLQVLNFNKLGSALRFLFPLDDE